jgi:hypothetical protein
MLKPSKETIAKHVKILTGLAKRKRNKGALPTYTWLNANGYFRSYEVMRAAPRAFKHLKRARAR